MLFHFPLPARTTILLLTVFGILIYITWKYGRFLFRKTDHVSLIAHLDRKLKTDDLFINAFQLSESDHDSPFVESLISKAEHKASNLNIPELADKSRLIRYSKILLMLVAGMALPFILFPKPFLFSASRALLPWTTMQNRIVNINYKIEPENIRASTGSDITVKLTTDDALNSCAIFYKSGQKNHLSEEMEPISTSSSNRVYSYTFKEINRDIQYHIRMISSLKQNIISPAYRIETVSPPVINSIRIQYLYPSYTGLPSVFQDDNGHVEALRGTTVHLTASATAPLKAASLVVGKNTLKANINRNQLSSSFTIMNDSSYFIRVIDANSISNIMPVIYTIRVLDDARPKIEIPVPGHNIDLPEEMLVKLFINASDDISLKSLSLSFFIIRSYSDTADRTNTKEIPIQPGKEVLASHDFSLKGLNLMPGDVLHYFAVADDGYPYDNTHKVSSEIFTIRFPSMADMYKQVDKEESQAIDTLKEIREKQEEYLQKMKEIQQQMNKSGNMDYIARTQMESLLEKQKELMENTQQAAEELEKTISKMEKNKMTSRQIVEKMRDIEKMMQEIVTKEMKEAMDKMRETLKSIEMSEKDRKELSEKMDQQEVLRKLDNTLKMLQETKKNRKLDELARRADEMLRKQAEINKETSQLQTEKKMDETKFQEIQNKQAENQQSFEDLKSEMEKASREYEKTDRDFSQKMENLTSMMEQRKTSSKMDNARKDLSKKDMNSAKMNQESVAKDLKELKEKMERNVAQKQSQNLDKLYSSFDKLIFSLLAIADEQADISDAIIKTEQQPFESKSFEPLMVPSRLLDQPKDISEKQLILGHKLISDKKFIRSEFEKVLILPDEFFLQFDQVSFQMQSVIRYLTDKNPYLAKRSSSTTVLMMHTLILQILDILKNVKDQANASKGQNLSDQMDQMSKDQQGLNESTEQLMGQSSKEGMSPEMQQLLKELAFQQEMIQSAFQEAMDANKEQAGKMLGNMSAISKEMEETAKKMKEGELSQDIIDSQKKILKKLLDSQKSLKVKEESPERRAEQADRNLKAHPQDDTNDQKMDDKTKPGQQDKKEKTPSEYEKTIKNYLRLLNQ